MPVFVSFGGHFGCSSNIISANGPFVLPIHVRLLRSICCGTWTRPGWAFRGGSRRLSPSNTAGVSVICCRTTAPNWLWNPKHLFARALAYAVPLWATTSGSSTNIHCHSRIFPGSHVGSPSSTSTTGHGWQPYSLLLTACSAAHAASLAAQWLCCSFCRCAPTPLQLGVAVWGGQDALPRAVPHGQGLLLDRYHNYSPRLASAGCISLERTSARLVLDLAVSSRVAWWFCFRAGPSALRSFLATHDSPRRPKLAVAWVEQSMKRCGPVESHILFWRDALDGLQMPFVTATASPLKPTHSHFLLQGSSCHVLMTRLSYDERRCPPSSCSRVADDFGCRQQAWCLNCKHHYLWTCASSTSAKINSPVRLRPSFDRFCSWPGTVQARLARLASVCASVAELTWKHGKIDCLGKPPHSPEKWYLCKLFLA